MKKFRRGFKTDANKIANEIRSELGLGTLDRLDPHKLADWLAIPIIGLTDLRADAPAIGHLLDVETDVFSAVTVFDGTRRLIVHNDGHALTRQASNLCHELAHGLLGHPPTPGLDDRGCRVWDDTIEDEASWLGGILLVTEAATMAIGRGQWTQRTAARHFGVSEPMIRFRMNSTGAIVRVQRANQVRRKFK